MNTCGGKCLLPLSSAGWVFDPLVQHHTEQLNFTQKVRDASSVNCGFIEEKKTPTMVRGHQPPRDDGEKGEQSGEPPATRVRSDISSHARGSPSEAAVETRPTDDSERSLLLADTVSKQRVARTEAHRVFLFSLSSGQILQDPDGISGVRSPEFGGGGGSVLGGG